MQKIDITASVICHCQPVPDVQCRLAEKHISALFFQAQQSPLDRADTLSRHIAIGSFELSRIITDVLHHRTQILKIQQQQSLIIGNLENDRHNTALRGIQFQKPTQQIRPHLGNSRPDRMPFFTENIKKTYRKAFELKIFYA